MKKQNRSAWYFLIALAALYFIVGWFNLALVVTALQLSLALLIKILPIIIFVFVFMVILNYYMSPQVVKKHLGKASGIKKWVIAVIGGVLCTGPIFVWYPVLAELKQKGVSDGFLATFLYNKAVKPFLLPLMIFYFGFVYAIILTIVMVSVSLLQGWLFDKLENKSIL